MTSIKLSRNSRIMLDWFERITLVLLFGWLCSRFYQSLDETPFNLFYLFAEGAVALFVLFRRTTDQVSTRPYDWTVGFVGTMLPMLVIPSGNGWSTGVVLLLAGLFISLGAKLSLRRSFGVVAANRGVKRTGLYAAVRHPMYLGYFLTYAGILMLNPSLFNLGLLSLWAVMQIARIVAEEKVLFQDETYRAHAEKVRFRLVPFVY